MKRKTVITLVLGICATIFGCGQKDISLDGKVVQIVFCRPYGHTPEDEAADAVHDARSFVSKLPSIHPGIRRIEGRQTHKMGRPGYAWLLTFDDLHDARHEEYKELLRENLGHRLFGGFGKEYLMHDATPNVNTTTHGRPRRIASFRIAQDAPEETVAELKSVLDALPSRIPSILRLEWGKKCKEFSSRPPYVSPHHQGPPPRMHDGYILLMTFETDEDRAAVATHPAYLEFEELVKANSDQDIGFDDYVADVEYIAN